MYGTVTDWIAYAASRGLVVDNTAEAQYALQRASDYIRTRYVLRLAPAFTAESPAVVEATYIAAAYEIATPGFWATTFTGSQAKVLTKVGDISWSPVPGGAKGVDAMLPTSPAIEALFFGASTSFGMFVV